MPCFRLKNTLTSIPQSQPLLCSSHTKNPLATKESPQEQIPELCHSNLVSAMLSHVLGTVFLIGGTVELLLAGVPPEIIAATGGWTSFAFLLYWRCRN